MDYMPRRILKNSQLFTVNHFPSKGFVMLCNTFCSATNIYPYERIEETPHNYSLYELKNHKITSIVKFLESFNYLH